MGTVDLSLLLPSPQTITQSNGQFRASSLSVIAFEGCDAGSHEAGYIVDELCDILGRSLPVAASGAGTIRIAVGEPKDEGYRLQISEGGVSILGGTLRAVYWGVQTLRQIVWLSAAGPLPAVRIEDSPVCAIRSYSDDISRRQVSTLRDFEFIITNLSRLKYTHYQPYMEDVIYVDTQPAMGGGRGRLTRDEVAHLVAFGKRHFIEIMPQLNSSGHCEHLLSLPEYAAWRYEGNLETLNPELPEVRSFLTDVYQQLFEQFPCEYFHMGLDEARGLGNRPDLYVDHTNWLADMVLASGRRPVMWHDMFVPYEAHFTKYSAEWLDKLNTEIILDQWVYSIEGDRAEFLEKMTSRGFDVLLSPSLGGGPCGAATPSQWENTAGLYARAEGNSHVIGTNNTTWNDSGSTDRHIHWRGHAVNAELSWCGAKSVDELPRVTRAFNAHFYGLRSPEAGELLDTVAQFGSTHGRLSALGTTGPRALAQTVDSETADGAAGILSEARELRVRVEALQADTPVNTSHLDHVSFGLERIILGAVRVGNAPAVRQAFRAGDTAALESIAAEEIPLVCVARARFGELWLRRHKPEGLEYADLRYRSTISDLQDLGWTVRHQLRRCLALRDEGFVPVDISGAANSPPRDLAPLPWGESVHDNVPWLVPDPDANGGNSLIWLRSQHDPGQPQEVCVEVGMSARVLHLLHAIYGGSAGEGKVAVYTVFYSDGATQEVEVHNHRDIADWWMPFGHLFGGGGAFRIDPSRCRLAYLSGNDQFQGHCQYHCWIALDRPGTVVTKVQLAGTADDASVVVAGLTMES